MTAWIPNLPFGPKMPQDAPGLQTLPTYGCASNRPFAARCSAITPRSQPSTLNRP
jgi:hypothetical protein